MAKRVMREPSSELSQENLMRPHADTCQAPWGCTNPTAKASVKESRKIDGLSLCRACYQYVFDQAKEHRASRKVFIYLLRAPARVPKGASSCEAPGCGRAFRAQDVTVRRFVGRLTSGSPRASCRACYQRAYEYKREHPEFQTLEQAWLAMPPREVNRIRS